MQNKKLEETLVDISVSLAVIKNDLEHIEERAKKIKEIEHRVERIENLVEKLKGAAIILLPIATTAFTLIYMFLTQYFGF